MTIYVIAGIIIVFFLWLFVISVSECFSFTRSPECSICGHRLDDWDDDCPLSSILYIHPPK